MTGQTAVEQGKEGEAEEGGQGECEVFGPFRNGDHRLPDCLSEHINESADAKDDDACDGEEGHDALPSFALLSFQVNPPHCGVGKVRRQARSLLGFEGTKQYLIIYCPFHVSSMNV